MASLGHNEFRRRKKYSVHDDRDIFRDTSFLCGEFTGHQWIPRKRPETWSFDVFFDLRPKKRLSKKSWGDWVNNREAGDLRRHHAYYDVTVVPFVNSFTYCGLITLNAVTLLFLNPSWCNGTNADLLSVKTLRTNVIEMLIKIKETFFYSRKCIWGISRIVIALKTTQCPSLTYHLF